MGVINNINGLSNQPGPNPQHGYCTDGGIHNSITTPISGWFGDVYNNIVPRDAISGINGITDASPPVITVGGHPFGTVCYWHKVRYVGPFDNMVDACVFAGSTEGATNARSQRPKFLNVHAKLLSSDPLPTPSEDMWYNTASPFSKYEMPEGIIPLVDSIPDNGYYIVWGKYGIDNEGVNFKLVKFLNNNLPQQISVKGECSF